MSTEAGTQPSASTAPQTENQAPAIDSGEISSLARYMARQKDASSAPQAPRPQAGEGSPTPDAAATAPQDGREPFIPRSRFDEVLAERNALRQQLSSPQAFQPQGHQPQFGAVPQFQAPQGMSPTGMVGQQPAPQQAPALPDFSDINVQRQWREKIAANPVTGLREFVSMVLQAEGAPLLQQFQQQILSQISPIQQSYVQQQLTSYSTQRQQADPSFSQVAPTFNQLVSQALQRGYSLTPQVLQAIEGIARAQSGLLSSPAPAPRAPFTEAPGGTGEFGQPATPQLTPAQSAVAKRFGMEPSEYAAYLRSYNNG